MVIRPLRFNFYLLLLLAGALGGCATTTGTSTKDRPLARLTVNVESNREAEGFRELISVPRGNPVAINILTSALLNETHVAEARLVDSFAGCTMVIQFNPMGTHLLEQYTAAYPGRRFAIAALFGVQKKLEKRWLAAPLLNRRISDGILAFTPDASREEADMIVRGLNNLAREIGNQSKPKSKSKQP